MFTSYARYLAAPKWTTLSLFTYVAIVFAADVPWGTALRGSVIPSCAFDTAHVTALVAILGTTISPYLFFWQAGQEVEEQHRRHTKPLCIAPRDAGAELRRIRTDTLIGMGFSHTVALCIILATAVRFTPTALPRLKPRRRLPKRYARWRETSPSRCSPSASLGQACLPFRSWPFRRICGK